MPKTTAVRPRLSEREVHLLIKACERAMKDYSRLASAKKSEAARSRAERLAWEYGAIYERLVDRSPGNPHSEARAPRQLRF
jgi:hypothetical protein